MDDLILKILTNTGPLVIVVGLFLLYLHKHAKGGGKRWKEKDEQLSDLIKTMTAQFSGALHENAAAIKDLTAKLGERPCLLEGSAERIASLVSAGVVKGLNGNGRPEGAPQ